MKAEMNSRCPDEPRAAGNRPLRRFNKNSAAKVTLWCRRVRCSEYAINCARVGAGDPGLVEEGGGSSGHAKRLVMKFEQSFAASS